MSYPFFFLLFGALVLSSSEGVDNTIGQHHNDLLEISDRHNPAQNVIPNPSLPDSSAKQICRSPCQKGWISYKGRCYRFIQKRMTWTQAEKTCWTERAGGHLTSITSEEENEFLCKLSQEQKETQFWTGGTYEKASGSLFKWSDGSLTTFIQRPLSAIFNSFRRLINRLFNIKICLTLNIGGGGEWDGSHCSNKLPFICVYKPNL
ncbi:PGCA protein, partial [Anseranas semipalmata]|nr:PGCA protein [Anseranas semipalmata]